MRGVRVQALVLAAALVIACGTPPNKEMDQAQGAIDAARAVGADRYAATEFQAATTSLELANDAVAQRDFRLALNHALESRDPAQNAAREAADTRARIRGEVERAMAEVAGLLAQANATLTAAEKARVARATLTEARSALAEVNADVQEAGAAMKADDFMAAQPPLMGVKERIEGVTASLEAAMSQSSRRRR